MYVRIKTSPNSPRKSVQIVEGRRVDGKVRQKVVRNVGIAQDDTHLEELKKLGQVMIAQMQDEIQPGLFKPEEIAQRAIASAEEKKSSEETSQALDVNLRNLREEQRVTIGIHEIYGKLYDQLGFDSILEKSGRTDSARRILKHLVLARNASPLSKRGTVRELEERFGVELSLSSVYRSMDHLDDSAITGVQECAHLAARQLFGEKLNVLFYDCTTLYFESFTEDELKQNGYSKDMKFNQPQVLLALLVTKAGIPVGYEVYPGTTFEGHTLKDAVEQVENKYQVEDLVFVADSAMLGKENLRWLDEHGKRYIVGARLKNMTKEQQRTVLDAKEYRQYNGDLYDRVIDLPHSKGRRLIVTYNEKRAKKDAKDRRTALTKLCGKLKKSKNPLSFVSSYGYKRFLKTPDEVHVEVDEKKVEEAAQWDGLHGVITNISDMNPEAIREHYHGLWQVEESFRITKNDLKVRPIYHWTPRRVKAHIALCFISLTLSRHLMYRTKLQYRALSAAEIRRHLTSVQVSIVKDIQTKKRYGIPSAITPEAAKLYTLMGKTAPSVPFEIKD